LAAIRESQGLVGVTFATSYLRSDGGRDADTTADLILKHVDHVLEHVGEKTAMIRVRAGISYALTEAMGRFADPVGDHRALLQLEIERRTDELLRDLEQLLGKWHQLIRRQAAMSLVPCIFLAGLHRAERIIAERLMRLANGTLPWPWIDG
jgi:hypothetical protein